MQRKGALSSQVSGTRLTGEVAILGSVAALACESVVLIPLAVAFITLIIAFHLIQLVDHNIRTWLRRSYYGLGQANVMGGRFKSPDQEANSLHMVFQGIDVEVYKTYASDNSLVSLVGGSSDDGANYADDAYGNQAVHLKVSVNDKLSGYIKVRLVYYTDNSQFKKVFYININKKIIETVLESNKSFSESKILSEFKGNKKDDPIIKIEDHEIIFNLNRKEHSKIKSGYVNICYMNNKNDNINNKVQNLLEIYNDVYEF